MPAFLKTTEIATIWKQLMLIKLLFVPQWLGAFELCMCFFCWNLWSNALCVSLSRESDFWGPRRPRRRPGSIRTQLTEFTRVHECSSAIKPIKVKILSLLKGFYYPNCHGLLETLLTSHSCQEEQNETCFTGCFPNDILSYMCIYIHSKAVTPGLLKIWHV